nr:hypothetical protein [Prolixibacteraceae bacterium]
MKLSFLLTILFLNIFLIKVFPQVDVKMIVRNPVPSEISVWAEDPTILQVVVSNMSSKDLPNCCLGFNITNEKGDRVIKTNIKSPSIPKFNIPTAPSVTMLNGNKIFNINSVTFNQRLMSLALSTNSIPEGDYEICVSVYDQYGKNITNGEEYCTGFSIYIPEPPILISPVDDDLLINAYPTFLWTPVTNYNPGRTQIKYKLKICPIYQGQTPRDAIDRNKVLFEKNDIYTTSYQYLPSDMAFDYFFNVTHFVWIIQAFDANNNPASSHEGKSELGIFKTVEESSNEVLYTNIFPEINDTIPWITPHLVTQFEPYADDIRSVNMKLSLHDENSTQTFTNNSTINFPQGPLASQQLINQEKASWLISNLDQTKAFATWMQNLEEGKKYFWKTEATFTKANGTTVTASTNETGFVIGLKQPTALFPKVDTSIQVNTIIETGLTIPSPNMLNLISAQELENFNFHGHNSYSTAAANVLFELSKTESFDSLMQSKTVQIPVGDELKSGNNCDDLFKNISTSFDAIADTGTYYWRAKYLNTNNLPYYTSAARRLKIVPILLATCFEMEVQQPANEGKWTKNKKPCFSVSVNPEINKSAITGGRIKVWIMDSDNENLTDVKKRGTVLDIAFTGNDDTKIYAHTTDLNGYTRYDLNFINGSDSTSTAFLPDSAAYYAWNFKLDYNKDSIRIDQQVCDSSYVMSNDGVFQQMPVSKKKNSCPGECFAEAPTNTSPGSQTLAKDSIISIGNFKIKLISVSGSPSSLTGEGSIDVPYMRANILVEFTGLQVNNENQVYGGEAYAKIDVDAPYTETEGNDFEDQAYSFASDKLKFKQIHEKSASLGKLVSGFTGTTPVTLPIGYDNDFDGYKFVVGIVGMRFTPTQGTLNATTYVELPSLGTDVGIGLGGKNICFHKDGLGGMDKAVLYLAQDFGYNSEESWDFLFKAPTSSDLGTYVMWDCEGMSDLEIAADVAFPRSWMTPVGNNDANAQVKAHFKGHSKPYGNTWQWMASASLDECELAGAEGYKIEIQDMVFDFSDTINPTGITYPAIYTGKKTTEWKGFYIKRATLTLPESMKTFDDENPKFAITNLLIDRVGITGSLAGSNLIQYPKGDFGGWGASIDSLKIDMVNSSLQSGSMKGRIKMSIADSSFNYSGLIAKNNVVSPNNKSKLKYQFSIAPKDTVDIDFVKSKINILPTSTIEMNNTEGNFVAQAVLNGVLEMDGEIGILKKIDFKGIKFEGFTVKSESPYFDLGAWGLASPSHGIAGFPVSIKNIEMVTGDRNGSFGAGLKFDLDIALQEEAMKGTTTLSVWGKMASESGAQHFEFDKIELDAIGINVDMGAVKIKGDLNLYNSDPTFGNGFRGAIDATFIDQVEITSTAQFGSVDGYRYWYVDGKALFNTGIPFAGISVYGFGGGAWYHMSKSGSTNLKEKSTSIDEGTTPGKTNSGFTFLPDENIGLGLKASIVMG